MVQTRSSNKKVKTEPSEANEVANSTRRTATATVAARKEPARKRQRTTQVDEGKSKRTRRNDKEKEKTSPRLNLDILFLIAEYLHPIDLLTLARTCESIRDLLMDRSSTFVWKAARRQIKGLPDCPQDLSEPEYANLVFYARCHSCGKPAQSILWVVRRRYCPTCRPQRMRPLSSSWMLIRNRDLVPAQWCDVKNVSSYRVDKEQVKAFRDKYENSSDKTHLLDETRELCRVILEHAKICEAWQEVRNRERSEAMGVERDKRETSVYKCLQNHGYTAELKYGWRNIRGNYIPVFNFRSSKPLTDKEWNHMRPEWIEVMDKIREDRLEYTVYSNRRKVLEVAYGKYLAKPSTLAESNHIFPPMIAIATFPPFDKIIKAAEESVIDMDSFEAAFSELPTFVQGWREKVNAAISSHIDIPSGLSSKKAGAKSGRTAKQKKVEPGLSQTAKLRLACSMFLDTQDYPNLTSAVAYPELLSFSKFGGSSDQDLKDQFPYGIEFANAAPYVIHACGLDPHVATVEDMEHRNPRLICLDCDGTHVVRTWRNAICHAGESHDETPRHWRLVDDKYASVIQGIERPKKTIGRSRCLLCKAHAGDYRYYDDLCRHLRRVHGVEKDAIQRDVHYHELYCGSSLEGMVEMVEEGGRVTFRALPVKK